MKDLPSMENAVSLWPWDHQARGVLRDYALYGQRDGATAMRILKDYMLNDPYWHERYGR